MNTSGRVVSEASNAPRSALPSSGHAVPEGEKSPLKRKRKAAPDVTGPKPSPPIDAEEEWAQIIEHKARQLQGTNQSPDSVGSARNELSPAQIKSAAATVSGTEPIANPKRVRIESPLPTAVATPSALRGSNQYVFPYGFVWSVWVYCERVDSLRSLPVCRLRASKFSSAVCRSCRLRLSKHTGMCCVQL